MSDLRCAATLLLVPYGDVPALAGSMAGARIAHVWTGRAEDARHAADALAAELDVGVTERRELEEPAHLDETLGEIADQHRGETVVVVVGAGVQAAELRIDGDATVRRPWPA